MRSTPQARTGKAKYRIDAFHELKDRASRVRTEKAVSMDDVKGSSRLGTKIINCKDVSFRYGDECYMDHFTYNFQRYEKVGIVGKNGAGKSTFLNLLTGNYTPDMVCTDAREYAVRDSDDTRGLLTGTIERGESLKIGYYRQTGMEFNPEDTVLDAVNDTYLLGRFLFPHDMLHNRIGTLSGGEKRRLYLLSILKEKPNLLILDEPTNDLDIVTLNVLEEYLKEFSGSLIIVSHDRHFLDRLADHLFVFCGDGVIKDFTGSYSSYRAFIKEYEAERKAEMQRDMPDRAKSKGQSRAQDAGASGKQDAAGGKRRLSYREQRELEQLEKDIEALNAEKAGLEKDLNSGSLSYGELQKASERIGEIIALVDAKETRWLELSII